MGLLRILECNLYLAVFSHISLTGNPRQRVVYWDKICWSMWLFSICWFNVAIEWTPNMIHRRAKNIFKWIVFVETLLSWNKRIRDNTKEKCLCTLKLLWSGRRLKKQLSYKHQTLIMKKKGWFRIRNQDFQWWS